MRAELSMEAACLIEFRGGRRMQKPFTCVGSKIRGSYSYRVASTCVHAHMYIFMALLLSATGQEDLFPVGNIASRRLPFPTGDLVWGAP